jgi:phospholipase D1/2
MLENFLESQNSIFKPGFNCWRVDQFRHAAVLIDCANFYRALHQSFVKAKKTIFIVGWEIDSGTRLLRGEEETHSPYPSVILNLLIQKAQENPELSIYLLPWDASIAFMGERDFNPEYIWTSRAPRNLHFCLDQTMPLWGSHHQKVILVDDEIVFTGGMDIARQRWDERDHDPNESERKDTNGIYGPYHDVQIVMDGPLVSVFAKLVRQRWNEAAGFAAEAISNSAAASKNIPESWPSVAADFRNGYGAIARTLPQTNYQNGIREVHSMYIDLISSAKEWIYIENQYLTSIEIAEAIRHQLEKESRLKVLIISSYDPQGIFESEAMWASRIDFRRAAENGINKNRIRFMCSGIRDDRGQYLYKRIHSKIIAIDERYLNVGSSNISNRSMYFDTECDFIIEGSNSTLQENIARVRNDLISEHCGIEISQLPVILKDLNALDILTNTHAKNRYHLCDIEDSKFTTQSFQAVAVKVADPANPETFNFKNPSRFVVPGALLLLSLSGGLFWFAREHVSWFQPENIENFLHSARSSPSAILIVWACYIVGGFILFPVTLMSLLTAAVFGSMWGPIYGLSGALLSGSLMFLIGRLLRKNGSQNIFGERAQKIDAQFRKAGVMGVTVLRIIPIAPFSIVNVAAGISSIRFSDFLIGSFLGFVPAFLVKGIVGDSLTQILINPDRKTILILIFGMALWIFLVFGSWYVARWWRLRKKT